jgi:intracellular multiplication protein IcmJ
MGFLPLVPLADTSAWAFAPGPEREDADRAILARDDHTCQFCGHRAQDWQEVFHLNGDHEDWRSENLVTSCLICHGSQHLGRPTIDEEFILIWLPEMSQGVLNALTHRIHATLYAHDEKPVLGTSPRRATPAIAHALAAYSALAGEAKAVRSRIHTAKASELGAVLLELASVPAERLARLLGGIRLLHRGRHFASGKDVYGRVLGASAATA